MAIGKPPASAGSDGKPARQDDNPPWHEKEDARADPRHPSLDITVANQARIYDYLLGGKDNFEADREAADAAREFYPDMVYTARANRAFLARAVRYLAAEAGVRQFLDIGTGIPAAGNTHQIAQEAAPDSKVVYVDNDPVVLSYAYALLTSSPKGAVDYIDADLRDPATILERAAHTLDFTQPIAVMMLFVLHVIGDGDDPYGAAATIMDAVSPGSYLAISHGASDIIDPKQADEATGRLNERSHQQFVMRRHDEVMRFFDGLEMVEPGLAQVQQWRPDAPAGQRVTGIWAGVGRKP